jgi:hypothetical protein
VALEQVSHELFDFLPVIHPHLSPPHDVCDSPVQAAHYRTIGPKLVASSLTWHLAGLGVKVVFSF